MRDADHAIERFGQNFYRAAAGGRDGEMFGGVLEKFRSKLSDEGDVCAVGRPGGGVIFAGAGGDFCQVRAFVGVVRGNDPDVAVVIGVGIGRGAVAGEGDLLAVRRPRGFGVVEIAAGDLFQRFCREIKDVDVGTAAVQVTVNVFLKLQTVDDPRLVGFFLFIAIVVGVVVIFIFVFCFIEFFAGGIAKDERHAMAVGGPQEIVHVLRGIGKFFGFAAEAIEPPNLGFAVVASGEKGEVFTIGAPARVRGGSVFGSQSDGFTWGASVRDGKHPDTLLGAVVFELASAYGVGEPFSVRAELGFVDVADLEDVVDDDGTGRLLSGKGTRQEEKHEEKIG